MILIRLPFVLKYGYLVTGGLLVAVRVEMCRKLPGGSAQIALYRGNYHVYQ